MSSNLDWLQQFYLSLCDGDWEHGYGCFLKNIDNPGWSFKFELADTYFSDLDGPDVKLGQDWDNEGPDWLMLRKVETTIDGACGPLKLDQLIGEFRKWIETVEPLAEAERLKYVED